MGETPRVRVFEIAWVKRQGNELQAAGRAYETLRIGDTLLACNSEDADGDCAQFRISKIKMYNRDIEEVDAIFACLLILEGADEEILRNSKYLFIDETE